MKSLVILLLSLSLIFPAFAQGDQTFEATETAAPVVEVTAEPQPQGDVIINVDNTQPTAAEDASFLAELTSRDIRELALYAIIAILLLILFKQNGKIAELVPQEFALAMVGSVVERAKETESKTDDRWAALLQTLVGWFYRPPTTTELPTDTIPAQSGQNVTVNVDSTPDIAVTGSHPTAIPVPPTPYVADGMAQERQEVERTHG